MQKWMASLSFKEKPTPDVIALVPSEQARVKELTAQGLIDAIYISNKDGKIWILMSSETLEALQQTLTTLPMYTYFNIEVSPLND